MQRLTERPWFGPKRYSGWGLTIASWQGMVVTVTAVLLVIASLLLLRRLALGIAVAAVVLVLFVIVALRTGDPPGGPAHPRPRKTEE